MKEPEARELLDKVKEAWLAEFKATFDKHSEKYLGLMTHPTAEARWQFPDLYKDFIYFIADHEDEDWPLPPLR